MKIKHTVIEGTSIPYEIKHGPQVWESIDDATLKARQANLTEERIFVIPRTAITVNPDEYNLEHEEEHKEAELISEEMFKARLDLRLAKKQNKQSVNQTQSFFSTDETHEVESPPVSTEEPVRKKRQQK